ncbi:MAG: helix-turn-helix domain-containing protein [Lachnospiraceae bacterium]|nr:helix-turn-helix domain-containing protein [Lachnospiraceae bacterium]
MEEKNLITAQTQICRTYSVDEIASILGISKSSAYELCKKEYFRTLRIGRVIRINKESFDQWFRSGQ